MMPALRTIRFKAPWWGWLFALAGCAGGVALGQWQTGRAAEKRAAAASDTRLELRGEFVPRHTLFLANRIHHGRPGFHVLQPLRLANGQHVLVNRGWRPVGPASPRASDIPTPEGAVAVSGVKFARLSRALEPPGVTREGVVWQNVTLEDYARWSGLPMEDYVLQQVTALPDGLLRDWAAPDAGVGKHESYALQWYALAVLSGVLFLVLNVRRESRDAPDASDA